MKENFVLDAERFANDATAAVEREQAVLEALQDVLDEVAKLELDSMGRLLIDRAGRLCEVSKGCNDEAHNALEALSVTIESCDN